MPLDRRLQLRLDEDRYRTVAAVARRRGTSLAAVVREAIDRGLPSPHGSRARALAVLLAAEPVAAPDPDRLRAELDEARGRHA
jgi:hypothetical protein